MTRSQNLPVPAVRAFIAVARWENLREAANSLGVTPSAISHQLRAMEAWVGTPLFERSARRVSLTQEGRALAAELAEAWTRMESALESTRRSAGRAVLKVSALPLFTNTWLVPRLDGFVRRHAGLSIEIETENRIADIAAGEADVGIRNVHAATPGLHALKLLDLRATPLCSPRVAQLLREPRDLADATLIEISAREGWAQWLAAAGAPELKPRRVMSFDTVPSAIEAAAQGQGVVLGLLPLVWDTPAAVGLMAPFPALLLDAGAYFAVCRRADRSRPVVQAFIDWIAAEMARDMRRLRKLDRDRLSASPAAEIAP